MHAQLLNACQFIGMATYKFRLLITGRFELQKRPDLTGSALLATEGQTKWLPCLPNEVVFPSNLFFSWDLTHFALRVQRLKIEARMEPMVNSLCLRIRPADFVDAIDNKLSTLQSTPLSKTWPLIRFNNKTQLPLWMKTLQQLNNSPNEHTFGVTCITHFPLETWKSMTKDKTRSCLPARPGPLKRFKAARNRFCKFKAALVQFSQQQVLETVKRTHLLAPSWRPDEPYHFCVKMMNVSTRPRNITSACPSAHDLPTDLLTCWTEQFSTMIADIDCIIFTLS